MPRLGRANWTRQRPDRSTALCIKELIPNPNDPNLHLFRARHKLQSGKVRPQFREATGAGRSAEAVAYYQEQPGRRIGRQAADQERGSKDCRQRGEAAGVAEKVLEPPLPAATLNLQGCDVGHTLRLLPKLPIICDHLIGVGVAMSRFIALGAVLAVLAAGASAKTLKITKITKSEVVVQHRAVEPVRHRMALAEPVDPVILNTHLQKIGSEGALP
jgi:hypothetical protein